MAKVIKNITVNWSWTGDSYALQGFNVAITPSTGNPKTGMVIQANADATTTSYVFNHVTLDDGTQYTAWVQAIYDGADSDWLSASNISVTDDGNATISTKSYTDTSIGNVQIGGRNLWLKTREYNAVNDARWVDNNGGSKPSAGTYVANGTWNGFGVIKITGAWVDLSQRVPIDVNTDYVLSAWVKSESDSTQATLNAYVNTSTVKSQNFTQNSPINSTWTRYWFVFNSSSSTTSTCRFESGNGNSYSICGLKLEKGNKPTDWSPAPEDIDSSISGITFAGMIGCVNYGNNVVKNTGTSAWGDGGFSSAETFTNGQYIESTVMSLYPRTMFGLSHSDTNPNYTSIQYAIYPDDSAILRIYENGTNVWSTGSNGYAVGDVFRIGIENNKIYYYQNGNLIYTSTATPSLPLVLDCSFYGNGTSINNINSGTIIGGVAQTKATLDSWRHASDTTKIDGGDIYTGSVTANQIKANTITANEIATGSITADKLTIGTGNNLVPYNFASFESYANGESVPQTSSSSITSVTASTDYALDGIKSLKVVNGNSSDGWVELLGSSKPIVGGKWYCYSFYAFTTQSNVSVQGYIHTNEAYYSVGNITLIPNQWNRLYATWQISSNATSFQTRVDVDSPNATVYFDCLQLEQVNGSYAQPSYWSCPSVTTLHGSTIRTGTINADKIMVDNGDVANGNLMTLGTITTNSGSADSVSLLTDGNKTVQSNNYYNFGSGNGNNNASENNYIQVDLGKVYRIAESRAYFWSYDNRYYWYKIKYSQDGTNWFYAVGNVNNNGWVTSCIGNNVVLNPTINTFFPSISARYVRLYANGNTINLGNHIYEWELFSANQTIIEGGQIKTNSITANQIQAGTITANEMATGSITISKLDGNTQAQLFSENVLTTNSNFANWTGSYPNGFGQWSTYPAPTKETTTVRNGLNAVRFNATALGQQQGIYMNSGAFISGLDNYKYLFVELGFMLVSGSISGAGLLVDWNGMATYRNTLKISDYFPSPVLNKWYTIKTVIQRPSDTTTGYANMQGYLMGNYSGIGDAIKNIIFDSVIIREASQQEIDLFSNKGTWNTVTNKADSSTVANLNTKGLGMKVNQDTFTTTNAGELYLHGFDANGNPADVDGFIYQNGVKYTVKKQMINPNYQCKKGFITVSKSSGGACLAEYLSNGNWRTINALAFTSPPYYWDVTPPLTDDMMFIGYVEMSSDENFTYATLWNIPMTEGEAKKLATVDLWSHSSDTTKIDGGDIYTGSITADKILANSITSTQIQTGGITANKISGGTLTLGGASNGNGSLAIKNASGTTVIQADADSGSKYNIRAMDTSGNVRAVFGEYTSGRYGMAVYNQYGDFVTGSDRPPTQNDSGVGVSGCYISLSGVTSGIGSSANITSWNYTSDTITVDNASVFAVNDYVYYTFKNYNDTNYRIWGGSKITAINGNVLNVVCGISNTGGSVAGKMFKISRPTGTLNISSGYVVNSSGQYIKVNAQSIPITLGVTTTSDVDGFVWYVVWLDNNGVVHYAETGTSGSYSDLQFIGGDVALQLSGLPDMSSANGGTVIGAILSGIPANNNPYHPNIQQVHQIFHDPSMRKQIPFYVDNSNNLCASNSTYAQWQNDGESFNAYEYATFTLPIGANKKTAIFSISSTRGKSSYGFLGVAGRRNIRSVTQYFFGMSPSSGNLYNGDYLTDYGASNPTLTNYYAVDGGYISIADAYIMDTSTGQSLKIVLYNRYSGVIVRGIYINAHAF